MSVSSIPIGLTFDDVLLVPQASKTLPGDVLLKSKLTKKIDINIPLISAAMDTVTEEATAIAIAKEGGIGIIHKNLSAEEQAAKVAKVKRAEYWVITKPITVCPDDPVEKLFSIELETDISSFPVIEKNGKLAGIVTSRDLRFEEHNSQKKAKEIMTKDLITSDIKVSLEKAREIMHKNRVEKLPLVDGAGKLTGLITITDILNRTKYPNALRDKKGRLMVGAAVGPSDDKRIEALIKAEADVIVVDTAHGHSKMVVESVKKIKKKHDVQLIAGNVATAEATKDLISAGADAIKVGVGPGAICTTRVISGVGVPQITAIKECSKAAEKSKTPIIADGGVKYSGDIVKAIAAGASTVMIGSLFAGCDETPGRVIYLNNRKFKQYRGMGSLGAMKKGSKDRYFQKGFGDAKLVPEGIEGIVPFKGKISEMVYQLLGGVRSGMGLVGAGDINALRTNSKMVKITSAGLKESHPHDVTITEQAPNYPGQ